MFIQLKIQLLLETNWMIVLWMKKSNGRVKKRKTEKSLREEVKFLLNKLNTLQWSHGVYLLHTSVTKTK
jgi:hypothetical protein